MTSTYFLFFHLLCLYAILWVMTDLSISTFKNLAWSGIINCLILHHLAAINLRHLEIFPLLGPTSIIRLTRYILM